MDTTPDVPEPGASDPGGARPLSPREQHALARLEAGVSAEDPQLSARMRRSPAPGQRILSTTGWNIAIQAAVVLTILVLVLPRAWVGVGLTTLTLAFLVGAVVHTALTRKG